MTFNKPTIFRSEAIEKYHERQYEAVFPQFLLPNTFLFLWLLLGLLFILGILALFAKAPDFISGQAVIVADGTISSKAQLVILVPAVAQDKLRVGQAVQASVTGIAIEEIQTVNPNILSPAEVTAFYDLPPGLITMPTAVAFAPFQVEAFSTEQYLGSLYPVKIHVGSQRLVTKLPLIGQFWGDLDE